MKEIELYWLNSFEALNKYKTNRLYYILKPFILGFELVKLPRVNEIRPHFVIYPLFKNNLEDIFKSMLLMFEFLDKKNNQFSIPYLNYKPKINLAINSVFETIPFNLNNDVNLNDFYKLIDLEINKPINKAMGIIPQLILIKFYASIFVSEHEKNKIVELINIESKNWNLVKFEKRYGSLELWLKHLNTINRSKIIDQVNKNINEVKLKKMICFEIILPKA